MIADVLFFQEAPGGVGDFESLIGLDYLEQGFAALVPVARDPPVFVPIRTRDGFHLRQQLIVVSQFALEPGCAVAVMNDVD